MSTSTTRRSVGATRSPERLAATFVAVACTLTLALLGLYAGRAVHLVGGDGATQVTAVAGVLLLIVAFWGGVTPQVAGTADRYARSGIVAAAVLSLFPLSSVIGVAKAVIAEDRTAAQMGLSSVLWTTAGVTVVLLVSGLRQEVWA